VPYESVNIRDGAHGESRWREAGRPIVPSLVVGGEALPILHVSQLAAALGLPPPEAPPGARLAADTADVLRAWLDQLRPLSWSTLVAPTPSRGRSLRNLTVNVFHPFTLLPAAWAGDGFPWDPEEDDRREAALATAGDVVSYAQSIHESWSDFLERADDLDRPGLLVPSPRGALAWLDLLDHQRWHAAFHYRQFVEFLDRERLARPQALPLALLEGLQLPADVF
jgi:hypothetical protein